VNVRLENATAAVRDAIATAADIPHDSVGIDDDLLDDVKLQPIELETLRLILEEIFGASVPDSLWNTPLYRTASSLAEWLIQRSNLASWLEAKSQPPNRRKCA
jgi:hypothetical protein